MDAASLPPALKNMHGGTNRDHMSTLLGIFYDIFGGGGHILFLQFYFQEKAGHWMNSFKPKQSSFIYVQSRCFVGKGDILFSLLADE